MARARVQVVREPRQLAAMASPVRLRLLAVAASPQPLSVAELAAQVGMAPASLYYHVQALVTAGLLCERGRRRAGTSAGRSSMGRRQAASSPTPAGGQRPSCAR